MSDDDDAGDYWSVEEEPEDEGNGGRNFMAALAEDEEEEQQPNKQPKLAHHQLAPPVTLAHNVALSRPAYVATDAVSDYNLGALMVLIYAHVTEGISTPVIFDGARQRLVTDNVTFDFS
jgi:hypothetical protein